ncbi:MAG: bifunctional glutamate N-acetyltransferase/amino-acid acetyltransferase ArgJ [Acidimicrobiia bacterium]
MDAMSVVAAKGFRAAGLAAGIKRSGLDMALIAADEPVPSAAVFTTSLTAAPPVEVSRAHLASGRIQAIVVNSGAANAGTGEAGVTDAEAMAHAVAVELGCEPTDVAVCSTGPIGGRLPTDRILAAIPRLVADLGDDDGHALAAAGGILTTDSVEKTASTSGRDWIVGGMAKGAGMVRPDMATMLAFLTTDAVATTETLQGILTSVVDTTFNALNIDGCQSTNDTVILMASGASQIEPSPSELANAVEEVCRSLALQMARDAEGASKVVTIEVSGAADDESARRIGMRVADSALVRSSFYGADPNWGRILAALGVTGEKVDQGEVRISYEGTLVCSGGVASPFAEAELSSRLVGDFTVGIGVGGGDGYAVVTTTDLTPDYVIFNGERS